jgi:hypothetical protein
MTGLLNFLEKLAKYGIIDIIFGIGVVGFLVRLIQKVMPSNYEHLHINVSIGGPVSIPGAGQVEQSISFILNNAGQTNFYVARAYFRPKFRRWWFLWLKRTPTNVIIHPRSFRIAGKDAFELKFQGEHPWFSDYETLVRPGRSGGQPTWLALEQPMHQSDIDNRNCGVLYIEYATTGKQGVHVVRV